VTKDELLRAIRNEMVAVLRDELGWLQNALDVRGLIREALAEDPALRAMITDAVAEAAATASKNVKVMVDEATRRLTKPGTN